MRALAFIFFAVGAPDAWALLDARAIRGSNRVLSEANYAELKLLASDAAAYDDFGDARGRMVVGPDLHEWYGSRRLANARSARCSGQDDDV